MLSQDRRDGSALADPFRNANDRQLRKTMKRVIHSPKFTCRAVKQKAAGSLSQTRTMAAAGFPPFTGPGMRAVAGIHKLRMQGQDRGNVMFLQKQNHAGNVGKKAVHALQMHDIRPLHPQKL